MRIFVSSTFEDLKEHRTAAIRVLRQLGHEILAMEDLVAASNAPLAKVIDMVDRSEAYVGVFAWRYGFIPGGGGDPVPASPMQPPAVANAEYTRTSITHYEYLRAVERNIPVMAFLLDERWPWPPQLVDGFDGTGSTAQKDTSAIRKLRAELQLGRVVSWFTTPADLEARVSAAVTTAGLSSQLNLLEAATLADGGGISSNSLLSSGITKAIREAGDQALVLKIDLATTWWSSRLFLIAALAERLTAVRRILIVHTKSAPASPGAVSSGVPVAESFVGQLSTGAILSIIGAKLPALSVFQTWLQTNPRQHGELTSEIDALLSQWGQAIPLAQEMTAKIDLTAELLRRWFGDAMLQLPVHIADLQRASIVDILRLLDYPNDFVPVLTRHSASTTASAVQERVDVISKIALNRRLARSYLRELMDRERIR